MINKDFMESFIEETIDKGKDQIRKELEDFWNMMNVFSKVLDRITMGRMSKPNYTWEAIKKVLDEIEEGDFN